MELKDSSLVKRLKEFLNSMGVLGTNVTPDEALQILSKKFDESKFKQSTKGIAHTQLKIFLTYTIYVVTKFPEANVTGICEKILCKVLKYSKGLTEDLLYRHCCPDIASWLDKALSDCCKCTNPYIRLELFRMVALFSTPTRNTTQKQLCQVFIHTICEIKPHHIYPSGNQDDIIFNVHDLFSSISTFSAGNTLQQIISADLIDQLKYKEDVDCKNNGAKFMSHCIQLIGVYAILAASNPDSNKKFSDLMFGCTLFYDGIGSLVNCGKLLPQMSPWQQFQYVITLPPFQHFVVETIQALTAAIDTFDNKLKKGSFRTTKSLLMSIRDGITLDLGVCHRTFHLPWLLLSRQVEGPKLVHQQALLLMDQDLALKELKQEKMKNNADEFNNEEGAWSDYRDVGSESEDHANDNDYLDNDSDEYDNESEESDSDSWIEDIDA